MKTGIIFLLFCSLASLKAAPLSPQEVIQKLEKLEARGSPKAKKALKRLEQFGLLPDMPNRPLLQQTHDSPDALNRVEKRVKKRLQRELKTNYLEKLENRWGACGGSPNSCLQNVGNYKWLNLPKHQMCFPYTLCGFYHCMEEQYQCEKVGNVYFTELAFPTCSNYQSHIRENRYSKDGITWIYEVMVCLQKGLADECEIEGNCRRDTREKTCNYITEFTLDFHPGCYINSHIGVCHLSLRDQINIWRTVAPYLTNDERVQAFKVVLHCLGLNIF